MPWGFYALALTVFEVDMNVGQYFVQAENKERPQKESYGCRDDFEESFSWAHFNTRGQKTPKTCGYHNAPSKSEHPIEDSAIHRFKKEDK